MRDSILTDEVIDNLFVGTPGLDWAFINRETQDGGVNCEWVFYETDPQQGQTIDPYDDYLVAPVDDEMKASIGWANYVFPFTLSKLRMDQIRGKDANINYLQLALKKTKKSARKQLSTDFFGEGEAYVHPLFAAKTNQPMVGLKKIVAIDRTYAGFDSTNYPQLDGYVKANSSEAYVDLYTASDADFLPDSMEEVMTETDYDDGETIDYIITDKPSFGAVKRAIYRGDTGTPATSPGGLRLQGGDYEDMVARAGIKGFEWEGVPLVRDGYCTTGYMYFLNSNSLFLNVLAGRDMEYEDMEPRSEGDAMVANFKLSCQVICTEPRRQGVITGIHARV